MYGGAMQYLLHNKQIAFRYASMNGGAMLYLLKNKQIAFRYTAMNGGAMLYFHLLHRAGAHTNRNELRFV